MRFFWCEWGWVERRPQVLAERLESFDAVVVGTLHRQVGKRSHVLRVAGSWKAPSAALLEVMVEADPIGCIAGSPSDRSFSGTEVVWLRQPETPGPLQGRVFDDFCLRKDGADMAVVIRETFGAALPPDAALDGLGAPAWTWPVRPDLAGALLVTLVLAGLLIARLRRRLRQGDS